MLTIYNDDEQEEVVALSNYDSLEALHALFQEKGFRKKEGGGTDKALTAKGEGTLEKKSARLGSSSISQAAIIQMGGGDGGGGDGSSEPAILYGLLTGAFIVGLLVYRRNRKKNARAVV